MPSAKKFFAQTKEGDQKRDLQRIDEIIHDLDCGEIEAKCQRSYGAERSSGTEYGKSPERDAEDDTQRDFFRRNSLAQEFDNRTNEAPLKKSAIVRGCRLRFYAHAVFWRNSAEAGSSARRPKS